MKSKITNFKILANIIAVTLCACLITCNNDLEIKPVIGTWTGDKAEFQVELIRVTEDISDVRITFNDDGSLVYTDDSQSVSGRYEVSDGKLRILSMDSSTPLPIDLTGTFNLEETSASRLVISGKRYAQIQHAELGSINQEVKATLFFFRPVQP